MVKYSKGFTLVELFMALAILGVTMLFAVPSFVTIMANNRISGNSSDFVSALQLAKAEAAARVNPVTICKSNAGGTACVAAGDGYYVSADAIDIHNIDWAAQGLNATQGATANDVYVIEYLGAKQIPGESVKVASDGRIVGGAVPTFHVTTRSATGKNAIRLV